MVGRKTMNLKAGKKTPQIVFRGGEPSAVILDIEVYQEMLQRLEDIEDLNMLAEIRKKPMSFRRLDDFLQEFPRRV
jgi:hypothetical protein